MEERRRTRRVPSCLNGKIEDNHLFGSSIEIRITDISADNTGLRFFSRNSLHIGKILTFIFEHQNQHFKFPAKIVYSYDNFYGCCKI